MQPAGSGGGVCQTRFIRLSLRSILEILIHFRPYSVVESAKGVGVGPSSVGSSVHLRVHVVDEGGLACRTQPRPPVELQKRSEASPDQNEAARMPLWHLKSFWLV